MPPKKDKKKGKDAKAPGEVEEKIRAPVAAPEIPESVSQPLVDPPELW